MSEHALKQPTSGEMIQVPNQLKLKVGSRFGALNAGAVAKAEAALKGLSSQFGQWLQDEVTKLEAARTALHTEGLNKTTGEAIYTRAHDLKGLGGTYEFPIISRIAGSLCKLIENPSERMKTPLKLIDAHVDTIKAAVRDNIRDVEHPVGRVLVMELERGVADYIGGAKGSSTAP